MLTDDDAATAREVPVRYGKLKPDTGEIVVAPPKKPAPPAAATAPTLAPAPATLIGQSLQQVEQQLGVPHGVRDEKPALVYEYSTARCSLDIVFFMDIERNQFRALSYDVRASGSEAQSPEACLGAIQSAKAKP